LTLKSKVKVQQRSLRYVTHRLKVMHPHTKYHWPISKETIIWTWGQRSRSHEGHYGMRHHLMVMHPHTNYHWPTSKDKNVMVRTRKYYFKNNYFTLRSKVKVPRRSLWYVTLPYGHAPTYEISLTYLDIWPWSQRSRSSEGHYGVRHTALWSCTHIPNIIDLSRKTKKLWSVQASLRRSGRKNQTKTICLPWFEGET
jgi:hypothetical protein